MLPLGDHPNPLAFQSLPIIPVTQEHLGPEGQQGKETGESLWKGVIKTKTLTHTARKGHSNDKGPNNSHMFT